MVKTKAQARVAVIMSTYNGEKHLAAQLDSIFQQLYPHIDIYIRDDGSTDQTVPILRRYAKKHKNIHFKTGKNIGYGPSFLETLSDADGYDYYAFCDQDDIWADFKIQRAVEQLSRYANDQPLLYGSSSDYYDADLNFQKHAQLIKYPESFAISMTECFTQGTCMVINQRTRELLLRVDVSKIYEHDRLTCMICASMGQVIYDPTPTIKYRRTGDNASPCGSSFFQLQIYRVKNFLFGPKLQKIDRHNQHFAETFYADLSSSNQRIASMFIGKKTICKQLKKTFYLKRWRRKIIDELPLRLLFLIGKL